MSPISIPKVGKADITPTTDTKTTDQLRQEIQDRLNQIQATEKEQSGFLSDTETAKLDYLQQQLEGALVMLDVYDKTGGYIPDDATSPTDTTDLLAKMATLKTGWNGAGSEPHDGIISPENTTGQLDENGNPIVGGLVLKMDDTMESVVGKNVGNDIEVTITYRDPDRAPETYLLTGMVKNTIPLIIAGDSTTKGITVNMAEVKRIGNKDPSKKDIIIFGGIGDDTLIGSQGADEIHAGAGADVVYGLGAAGVAGVQDVLKGDAGDDTITGGAGKATITGDLGSDTIYTAGSDNIAVDPEQTDSIKTIAFAKTNFLSKDGSWNAQAVKTSGGSEELQITNVDGKGGGELQLTIPDGYLAYAKQDGKDLVLTLQHIGPDGMPDDTTETVRIEGILDSQSHAHLTIVSDSQPDHPNMIDLSGVNTQFNQITLQKGQGNDVIVAPHTALGILKDAGIKSTDFGKPAMSDTDTKAIYDKMKEAFTSDLAQAKTSGDKDGFLDWAKEPEVSNGVITLKPKAEQKTLEIPTPTLKGYTYYTSVAQPDKDGKGTTITCFLKSDDGSSMKRVVIHVMGNPDTLTIKINGSEPPNGALAVQFLAAAGNDSGGGTFVGDSSESDSSGVGGNKVIDQ